ncbi:MAG: hypothetical protein H7039_04855 [Bryobacteraceae bacterium]|nr:hypothetical protein [Bryobacteraceae bacterium]
MSEGRFVFSGDSDSAPSYSVDWTVPGGMTRLQVTTNTRQVLDVNGTSFSVARTAGQIFDTREVDDSFSANNVFNAVYQLGVALESDDVTAVRSAAALINVSLDHLGRELTFYGNSQNRVKNAQTLAKKAILSRSTELAQRSETDLAKAIIELSSIKVHREAALGAQAQQPRSSLFDYLA